MRALSLVPRVEPDEHLIPTTQDLEKRLDFPNTTAAVQRKVTDALKPVGIWFKSWHVSLAVGGWR